MWTKKKNLNWITVWANEHPRPINYNTAEFYLTDMSITNKGSNKSLSIEIRKTRNGLTQGFKVEISEPRP